MTPAVLTTAVQRGQETHPLILDLIQALDDVLEGDLRLHETADAPDLLAERSMQLLVDVNPLEIAYTANLVGLLNSVLAAGPLDEDRPASRCRAALSNVAVLLHGPADAALLRSVREILVEARDGVALESGRRPFYAAVRKAFAQVGRLHPNCLDLLPRTHRLLLGGRPLTFRVEEKCRSRTVVLRLGNSYGRLLLLLAIWKASAVVKDDVVSRVRTALTEATQGRIRLLREPLRLDPVVTVTPRARAAALSIAHHGRALR